jgi:integrase
MAHVSYRVRKETGKFVFDVRIGGCRVRPQTNLKATKANERLVEGLAKKMNAEIEVGTFDIEKYFPNSDAAKKVATYLAESDAKACPSDSQLLELDIVLQA